MANTLTGLIPVLYEGLDQVSRELVGFTRAASMDSTSEEAAVNQTVRSPVAPEATTEDVTPGNNPADSGDQEIGYVDMKITNSKVSPIRWSGEEQISVGGSLNTIMVDQVAQSIRALVNLIEADCAANYIAASRAYGTAGTSPFGTAGDFSDFANINRILDDNGAPPTGRQLVLGSAATANIRGKQSGLFEANRAGNEDLLRRGIIGDVEGLEIHNSAQVKRHTQGTGAGYLVNNLSDIQVGGTTIAADTGTGTILAGDIAAFAADTANKYVVASAISGGSFGIAKPGSRIIIPNDNAITVGGAYTANMAFTKGALQLATRHPAMPKDPATGRPMDSALDVITITDPISGLSFQVAMYAQYRRVKYEIGIAWGSKLVKPEHSMILLG